MTPNKFFTGLKYAVVFSLFFWGIVFFLPQIIPYISDWIFNLMGRSEVALASANWFFIGVIVGSIGHWILFKIRGE